MRVAILGMGPSADVYARHAVSQGSRDVLFDETWTCNAFATVFQAERVFHMDDVLMQRRRARAGQKWITNMLRGLKKHPGPIYTSVVRPGFKNMVEFPLQDVLNSTGGPVYFNGTMAYAVAMAIHLHLTGTKVEMVALFGCDYAFYHEKYKGEKGRACVEYWLGRARGYGIDVHLPAETWLMDTREPKLYGYDAVNVLVESGEDGKAVVSLTEKERLPTAKEMEQAYEHA